MPKPISLSVMVPALNEEKNLKNTVTTLIRALEEKTLDWEIILVNDGSRDGTPDIANELAKNEPRIKLIHHPKRQGLGACWKDGVCTATKNAIVWFPGDGENDPVELVKYLFLLEHVDMIIPHIINHNVRAWYRRFLSRIYLLIINISFGTMISYFTGNIIYRRKIFEIVKPEVNGFFTLTECPIKAITAGFTYAQIPVELGRRQYGRSTILSLRSIVTIIYEYFRLLAVIHSRKKVEAAPATSET